MKEANPFYDKIVKCLWKDAEFTDRIREVLREIEIVQEFDEMIDQHIREKEDFRQKWMEAERIIEELKQQLKDKQ